MPKKKEILQQKSVATKVAKRAKKKAPESCLDAQESNKIQGHTSKTARLHESTSKKLCFSSGHLLGCQTKCSSLQTEEAQLIGWLVFVLMLALELFIVSLWHGFFASVLVHFLR
jgi:hypothetical protein